MRSFRKNEARMPISVLCIVILCFSLCGTALLPMAASGQTVGTIEVAVVDFNNNSKLAGQLWGRMATDAVVVELIRSGKFNVTPSDALDSKMKELGYQVPLSSSMAQRLGQEIPADSVISGEVISVKYDQGKKQAQARIAVRMLDVTTGELVNGAVASGQSHSRVGYSGDQDKLLIEAISDAAKSAVETLVQYIIPEATILSSIGTTEVLLNKGSQEGLEVGMEMIVLRRGEAGLDDVVGRVRVSKVTDTDSVASIIKAPKGVKPEDRVRAVYQMPPIKDGDVTQSPRKTDEKKSISKGTKLLFGALALIGLAMIFDKGGSDAGEVPGVVAMAGASPDVTTLDGEVGIMVAWDNPRDVGFQNIIEFHVWRDNRGNPGGSAGDGDATPIFAPHGINAPPMHGYDHCVVDASIPRSVDPYVGPNQDHTELEEGTMENVPGFEFGKPHRYYVSCVYKRVAPGKPADQGGVSYWETSAMAAGIATALHRPVLNTADTGSGDLSNVTFTWESSGGADLYVLEVSKSPNFERNLTWVYRFNQRTSSDGLPMSKTFTSVLSDPVKAPELQGLESGQQLYWRVGARNSVDSPGPVPAGPSPQPSGDKNTRYIYGLSETFEVGQPPFPGGDDDGGGGNDGGGGGDFPPSPF